MVSSRFGGQSPSQSIFHSRYVWSPDRLFPNFRASKSVNRRFRRIYIKSVLVEALNLWKGQCGIFFDISLPPPQLKLPYWPFHTCSAHQLTLFCSETSIHGLQGSKFVKGSVGQLLFEKPTKQLAERAGGCVRVSNSFLLPHQNPRLSYPRRTFHPFRAWKSPILCCPETRISWF